MQFKVHQLVINKDDPQEKLEQFLNELQGELVSVVTHIKPTFQLMGATATVDYLLIIEKLK